ncbi:MAG: hypothetical protein ABIE70_08850 [bacterium]
MMPIKTVIVVALVIFAVAGVSGTDMKPSFFDQELLKTRYDLTDAGASGGFAFSDVDDEAGLPLSAFAQTEDVSVAYKSPARAFLYSMAVPGLGQYYYGSKIKPFIFLAVEVLTWSQALKHHSDGNTLTDEYEAFNYAHWKRDRYHDFLMHHFETIRPDTLDEDPINHQQIREIIEVLPTDTTDQQYFEMTGKYDQFSWGWDDAELDGLRWEDHMEAGTYPARTTDRYLVPSSANRNTYEVMRGAANAEYSKSLNFVFGIMANHLISAFEAYFLTKHHNNALRHEQEFSRINVDAQLRSFSAWKDTPYVTVTYKF